MSTEVMPEADSVVAALGYMRPQPDKPYNYTFEPPPGAPWENCEYEDVPVRIGDARRFLLEPGLDVCGFQLVHAPTQVRSFRDELQVLGTYYEELRTIARDITGGSRAYVFDHLVRRREQGRPSLGFGRRHGPVPGAVGRVHNDYTESSGRARLGRVIGADAAARLGAAPFCIVNVWRGIATPVIDAPLALCDSRSVVPKDLVAGEVRYPSRTGEVYLAHANPSHRWAYFQGLERDEAIVFKQFDSRASGVSRFTLHAAFEHPHTPADAPLRESIEARVLVIL